MQKEHIIIQTALRLFVENGFHGTATSKIAEQAGIANGTLFNYYPTKEILVISIYHHILNNIDDYIIDSIESHSVSKESFRSLFIASVKWNLENTVEFKYLQQFNTSPYLKSPMTKTVHQDEQPLYVLIQKGIDLVLLKQLPAGFILSLFTAQVNGLFFYLSSAQLSEEEAAILIEETFNLFWIMVED